MWGQFYFASSSVVSRAFSAHANFFGGEPTQNDPIAAILDFLYNVLHTKQVQTRESAARLLLALRAYALHWVPVRVRYTTENVYL